MDAVFKNETEIFFLYVGTKIETCLYAISLVRTFLSTVFPYQYLFKAAS